MKEKDVKCLKFVVILELNIMFRIWVDEVWGREGDRDWEREIDRDRDIER